MIDDLRVFQNDNLPGASPGRYDCSVLSRTGEQIGYALFFHWGCRQSRPLYPRLVKIEGTLDY